MGRFRAGQELIDENLHITLLSSKVLNGHFKLVKGMSEIEVELNEIVEIKR